MIQTKLREIHGDSWHYYKLTISTTFHRNFWNIIYANYDYEYEPFQYIFEIHDGCIADVNGLGKIYPDDTDLMAEFIYQMKLFCRKNGAWIIIRPIREIGEIDSSYFFPQLFYWKNNQLILEHLERWNNRRIRSFLMRWYRIVQSRKYKKVYNILCCTMLPNDTAYTITQKVCHQAATYPHIVQFVDV